MTKEWVVIDAADEVLGRLASQIAKILRGKNKPSYTPHVDCGDYVIVINADKVKLTAKNDRQGLHASHRIPRRPAFRYACRLSGQETDVHRRKAVKGMLPRTRLGAALLRNLKVYAGTEHPHAAQNPKTIKLNEIK